MGRIALDLGFIQIYWYSIFIFLGMFLGLAYALKEAYRIDFDTEKIMDMAFYLILFGIIGARLYYVAFNFGYYKNNFMEIFEIWNGGLAIHGGILFGFLYLVWYSYRKQLKIFKILDIMVVALLIGQIIGRWGNFFNQEAYGKIVNEASLRMFPTFIRNGMKIGGFFRQPVFLYESVWNFIGLCFLLVYRKRSLNKNGALTSFYLIWYGIARLMFEGLRTDSLMIGNIRVAYIISIIMIILGIYLFIYSKKGMRLENLYNGTILTEEKNNI